MPVIRTETDIDIVCEECGKELDVYVREDSDGTATKIEVEPCQACLAKAQSTSYDEGHSDGYDEGTGTND
jgi:hypothetical protein